MQTAAAITARDWDEEFNLPHVVAVSPSSVTTGMSVALAGTNFEPDDVVQLNGTSCATTFLSSTELEFVVPDIAGAVSPPAAGIVVRADGRTTKPFGLQIRPTIAAITPAAAQPGQTVTVSGTGFPGNAQVLLDGERQPEVQVQGPDRLTFTVRYPAQQPTGGRASVTVALSDGSLSNQGSLQLIGTQVLVLGDSIAWGQGLLDTQKWASTVSSAWSKRLELPVDEVVLAHSGAIIGARDQTIAAPLDGEIPTNYPTILEQIDAFTGATDGIGLVLLVGGINDCKIENILSPTVTDADLIALADQYCGQDMGLLLDKICATFPAADVCAAGYYQILSSFSLQNVELDVILAFLAAAGVAEELLTGATLVELGAIAERCGTWATRANQQLAAQAQALNGRNGRQILFADPGFTGENAALTPNSLVFGLNLDLSPQDQVAAARQQACQLAGVSGGPLFECERASVGHPNVAGADAYVRAVSAALGI